MRSFFFYTCRSWIIVIILALSQGCGYGQATKDTVCITRTGTKYHRCSCQYLRQSSFNITLREAIERGYSPCSVCRPSSSAERPNEVPEAESELKEKGPASSSGSPGAPARVTPKPPQEKSMEELAPSKQCAAYTKSGLRCKRTTTNSNGRCWQHQ